MNKYIFSVVHFCIDLVILLLLYLGYYVGVRYGVQLIGIDLYFIRILTGIMGIFIVLALFRWLYKTVLFLLKYYTLQDIVDRNRGNEEVDNPCGSVKKAFCVGVAISLNYAVSEILKELFAVLKEVGGSTVVSQYINEERCPVLYKLSKCAMFLLKGISGYVDECVVAYTILHTSEPLKECVPKALTIMIHHFDVISVQFISISVIRFSTKVVLYLLGIYWYVVCSSFSLESLIIVYILLRGLVFAVDDAFLEPMLMSHIVTSFLKNDYTSVEKRDDILQSLQQSLSSLNVLDNITRR